MEVRADECGWAKTIRRSEHIMKTIMARGYALLLQVSILGFIIWLHNFPERGVSARLLFRHLRRRIRLHDICISRQFGEEPKRLIVGGLNSEPYAQGMG